MEKLKALWASFMANPTKFLKFLIFSLDHTDRGASIKKLLAWVVAACIVFLHVVWYKYQAAATPSNFSLFTTILFFDGGLLGALIGINFLQESNLKTNDNKGNSGGDNKTS